MEKELKIIPLGGLGEVGRNMTLFEFEGKILILDMGFKLPEEEMPGIDYVIPNIEYLRGKEENILGIVFTHGHYDHIGAVPYLIEKIWRPNLKIFASPLTRAIVLKRQEDFPEQPKLKIKEVKDKSKIKLGPFEIEFFRQNHNIPDNLGLVIKTPIGNIVHTSDFKFDKDPLNEPPTDFEKLKEIGKRGVLLLMSDSTGAEEKGHSLSEREIFKNLDLIFREAKGRIIAATFSSLLNRIQQLIDLSQKYKRKIGIDGYSMITNVKICQRLNYIKIKKGFWLELKELISLPDRRITLLCTGAQGEPDAILMKIANQEHKFFRFKKGDTVIFSSSIVPGNERLVQNLKDNILRQGAKVFHYKMMDIHASGHARQKELEKMINLIRPKFFFPVHGQYSMLVANAEIAKTQGISEKNIILIENGKVVKITKNGFTILKETVPANYVMVDGLGIGDVGEIVLRDRKQLAKDGMFVIVAVVDRMTGKVKNSPDIISRGFVYLRESKELLKETRKRVIDLINKKTSSGGAVNFTYLKNEIRNEIGEFLFQKTKRRPMVLPVIIEV
jgi:ribonuclease J